MDSFYEYDDNSLWSKLVSEVGVTLHTPLNVAIAAGWLTCDSQFLHEQDSKREQNPEKTSNLTTSHSQA